MHPFFGGLIQIFSAIPFIPFVVIWMIGYIVIKDNKRAFQISMDLTTIFLIISVSALFNNIFSSGFGFFAILLFFLLCAGLIGNTQHRLKGRLNLQRILRACWRIGFVVLTFFYFLFLFIGIGQKMMLA
jgi:hypothetical protein